MGRVREWLGARSAATLAVAGIIAVVVLGSAFIGVSKATDRPSFCRSCHEMTPYHDAWSNGPHRDVSCIECHVDPGEIPRLLHKFVALGEVVSHVRGDTSFPRDTPASVPDERCTRCHEQVVVDNDDFDHALHARRGPCQKCHGSIGHSVSVAALKAAGVYSGVASSPPSSDTSAIAIVDGGRADLSGHVSVACSRCHRMSKTKCSACHEPPHTDRGECATCHKPGAEFAFSHPKDRSDCQTCHEKGPTHTTIKGACSDCHTQPGIAWSFVHPATTAACTDCHTRPADHRAGACSSCHVTGVSWGFAHPGGGSACSSCHARPASHASGECSTCHAVGSAWRFRHPSSSSCASCHRAPANHYGSSCSSCHSPGRAWSNATFSHRPIPGGEHTYRSFACANCHPNGYSTHTCVKCHDTASGPNDD